jgi:hypothetical protein
MVVKDSKTRKKAGRPPIDPADLRTERIALRVHPDLLHDIDTQARDAGFVRSVMIERILIAYVNHVAGVDVLDAIGRRIETMASMQDRYPADWHERMQAAPARAVMRLGSPEDRRWPPRKPTRKPPK